VADEVETIVVDSGSTDGSLDLARSRNARVIEIPNSEFRHGATRNRAAEVAHGDTLVFTTQDARAFDDRWLERLCAPLRTDDELAGVYGRQIPRDDAIPPERFLLGFLYGCEPRVQRATDPDSMSVWTTLFSNSNSAVKRAVWKRYPFDEEVIWGEDQDWARRVLLAGYAVRYEPKAVVEHSHDNTVASAFKRGFDTGVTANRGFLAGGRASAVFLRESFRYGRAELSWLVGTRKAHWIPYTILYELAKFIGVQFGSRHAALPTWLKKRLSTLPEYWAQ
jgi:rhamnosyltransferase